MTSFLGVQMSQNWKEIPLWEEFFNQNPIQTMIELGTGAGGMTIYLALQCRQRGIVFHTFDHQRWLDFDSDLVKFLNLADSFHHLDIFSDGKEVIHLIQNSRKPLAVFFDNGNKPLEWLTFSPFTAPGDFCVVHDWKTEFYSRHIGSLPVERTVTIHDGRFRKLRTIWFKRI